MAHQFDCDFEAGKRECEEIENFLFKLLVFYLQHSIIKNIHNAGQRHIIVHTDLTTEM